MRRFSILVFGLSALWTAATLSAAEVQFFQTDTRASFLTGTLDGVSVDTAGRLSLGMDLERTVALEEPFAFAAVAHPQGGVVVGTGNSGRVLHVSEAGEVRTLFETEEPQVFALWVDPDGTVYAGSSPGGKVYRWREGSEARVFFDSGEVYVWALERRGEDLLVATGTTGKLFQVDPEGVATTLHDLGSGHIRTLSVRSDGSVLIGTAGEGLVQHLRGSGSKVLVRTLYDADEPEIVALEESPDGTIYAAALASESSLVDLSSGNGSSSSDDDDEDQAEGGSVKVVEGSSAGSRRSGYQGPRTRLLDIAPSGAVETRWETDNETVFDLAWRSGRLWAATGLEGQVFSFDGDERVLEATVEDRQIVALVEAEEGAGPTFVTSNAAAVYRPTGRERAVGTYQSVVLDAGQLARFGTLRWRGELPPGAELQWSVRSGLSATPDATWSTWQKGVSRQVDRPTGGVALAEVALAEIAPPGRRLQWRVRLAAGRGAAGRGAPVVSAVEVSYRQVNVAPKITAFQALDPGEVLVRSNFNPSNQIYEPASPNRDGIFTTVGEDDGKTDARLKTLWKKGYRSLRWTAEDGNGDELRYRLSVRPEEATAADPWMVVEEDLEATHYSFDATALPDGIYRFRLEADDREGNEGGEPASETQVTGPVLIDHTVPELAATFWRGTTATVELVDRWNPLRQLEVSVDGEAWRAVQPTDGLLDGRRESVEVEVPSEARLVLLRAMDAAFNVKTFDLRKAQSDGASR
ncbi:MAG: hypothetical protein AAF481_17620 [Acidobacteriota bacterium]